MTTSPEQYLLASIVESSQDSIVTIDLNRIITSWNKGAEHLYGYKAEEVMGQPLSLVMLPGDIPGLINKVDDILQEITVPVYETLRIHKEGQELDLEILLSPVRDASGRVTGVSTIARDISLRKTAEDALRESEARFRTFVTATSDVVYTMSADWKTILQLEGKGFVPDANHMESWLERYIPEHEKIRVQRTIDEAIAKKKRFDMEHQVIDAHGRVAWAHSRAIPRLDEHAEIIEWIGSAADITRRKEIEIALAASEAKYRTIFERIDEGFTIQEVITDENDRVVDMVYREVNTAFEKHAGIKDAVGKKASGLVPHLEQHWLDAITHVYRTGEPLRKEGYQADLDRWMTLQYSRVGDAGSKLLSVVFRDITEGKHLERRREFFLKLSDALRAAPNAGAVANRALLMLGRELGLDRCYIASYQLDTDHADILYQAGNDRVPPLPDGGIRLSDFPQAFRTVFDGTLVIDNFETNKDLSETDRSNIGALGLRALVATTLRKGDKRPHWVIVSVSAVPRHWTQSEIIFLEEVTERIYAAVEKAGSEEMLRASEKRFQSIANLVPDLLWDSEPDGSTNWCNQRWLEYTGQSPEQALRWGWTEAIHPDDREGSARRYSEAVEAGAPLRQEHRIRRYDGVYRWFVVNAVPLKNEEGRVIKMYGAATDIHDNRQAQDALRKSEDRLRILADAVPQVIWANRANGEATYFNKRWYEYTRLTYAESRGPGWQAIVHPDDAPASKERWQEVLATGEIFDAEYRLRRADGSYRWFIGRNVPLKDESGRITGWFGSATDIHELKITQQELHESNERLRVTMESAVEFAIITTDMNGNIQGWSRGAEAIFGYAEKEVEGKSVDLIFTPEDRAAYIPEEEMRKARLEGRAADERWHLRRDGSRFYMSGVTSRIDEGGLKGYVKVARDMTWQKAAEEHLRVSEERHRAALQSAEMAAWDWDVVANTIIWNEQHYRILGIEPDGQTKDAGLLVDFVHPDDKKRIKAALEETVQQTGIYHAEFRIVRADNGHTRWMNGYGRAVVVDESGKAIRMVGVMYDITERKLMEQQREHFIAIASHELRTPVTSIKAYTEMLEEFFVENGDKASAGLMRKMDVQVDRLTSLIYELLDSTRITEGKLQLQKAVFFIDELILDVVETMQRIAGSHRIELNLQAHASIHADPERIRQVLTNLVSNAVKYAPGTERVIVSSAFDGNHVVVCIQDFGIGMDEQTQRQLFEPFFRSQEASRFSGLGLGLYISAGIVRQHGGNITVESSQGKGATFCFTIPQVKVQQ